MVKAQDILQFWFKDSTPEQWFRKDDSYDQMIRAQFFETHAAALRGELAHWRETPQGRLAEVIVLDQFSRNLFRNRPEAFVGDLAALILAQEAVRAGIDLKLGMTERQFLYMPYMHSESRKVHRTALELFTKLGEPGALQYEILHKEIIDRFGRYPHRNEILGRDSTPEEIEFLKQPNSSF